MAKATRGFLGRGKAAGDPRLPPGHYDAGNQWPVLNAEVTPHLDLSSWSFSVEGLVARPTTWTWEEIHALADSISAPTFRKGSGHYIPAAPA